MEQKPVSRLSDDEKALIQSIWSNEDVLKLTRKIFLPEITADAPIGGQVDLWMSLDVRGMVPEQAMSWIIARNSLINHLEACLQMLQVLANTTQETPEQQATRLAKDSAQ